MGKMNRKHEKTLRLLLLGIGMALLCAAYYHVWVTCYNPNILIPFYRRGNYILMLIYFVILMVCMMLMKGHTLGDARVAEVVASQCIAVFMSNAIIYFPMSLLQYKLLNPVPLLVLLAGQWVIAIVWNYLANKLYFTLIPPQKMLLISGCDSDGWIAKKLNSIPERYNVSGEISVSEGREAIEAALEGYDAVLLAVKDDEWRGYIARLCLKRNMQVVLSPTLADVIVSSAKSLHSVDTPLLCSTDHHLTVEERALKRTMDIVGSAVAIILFSPILIFTAIAIKLGDGGPVLFRQERLTRDGRVFRICKFRSMVVDAEKDGQRLASEFDERITPVGRVIRRLRVDEFPQFFNVLMGDMSLVGPRPECPAIAAEYEKTLPEFAYRLKVKAGITGYAQVYGNYSTHPEDKLTMDIMYIESYSFMLDINLIMLTVRALLMPDKTRGTQSEDDSAKKDVEI